MKKLKAKILGVKLYNWGGREGWLLYICKWLAIAWQYYPQKERYGFTFIMQDKVTSLLMPFGPEDLNRWRSDWDRFKLLQSDDPVYVCWRTYYHVDPMEYWGVKQFQDGATAVAYMEKESHHDDCESSFSCWVGDRDDWDTDQALIQEEKDTGYRTRSRDHQMEAFEG